MSLTALTWKRLAAVTIAGSAINQVLDGIYTSLTATTYSDGSARTPGAGNAWSTTRLVGAGGTEGVYCFPVVAALNHRVVFGGSASARTPTMAAPDTWVTNCVMVGIAKNGGVDSGWDTATPFNSGQFYGLWRVCASTTIVKVQVFESAEALIVCFESAAGLMFAAVAGAYIDPETTSALSAESDGRRYGLAVSHPTTGISALFHEVVGLFLGHVASLANNHHMVADVGAVSTFSTIERLTLAESAASSNTYMVNADGEAYATPMLLKRSAVAPNDRVIGVMRQILMTKNATHGQYRTSSTGTLVWHYLSGSSVSASNAVALKP